mmetsp:Transcript_15799/g.64543  ORF Transcript_15799/g.64543 Transcript_15799/m.64543 type:complete len:94 (-) Transcript_15799:1662-1943(-)
MLSDARRSNGIAGDEQWLAEFMTVGLRGLSELHLETLNLLESVEYRQAEETEVFDFVAEVRASQKEEPILFYDLTLVEEPHGDRPSLILLHRN